MSGTQATRDWGSYQRVRTPAKALESARHAREREWTERLQRAQAPDPEAVEVFARVETRQDALHAAARAAGLSQRQTQALLLYDRGYRVSEIALVLFTDAKLRDAWELANRTVVGAERKLRKHFGDPREWQRDLLRETLQLVRNKRLQDWEVGVAEPPTLRSFGPSGLPRARVHGETLDDYLGGTRAYLDALIGDLSPAIAGVAS